jgi:hypothetical protein
MSIVNLTCLFVTKIGRVGLIVALLLSCVTLAFTVDWQGSQSLAVGVVYQYWADNPDGIRAELNNMKNDGFQIVSIPFVWSSNPADVNRGKTDFLLDCAEMLGLQIYLREPSSSEELEQYLAVYSSQISYVQIINEADIQLFHDWSIPGRLVSIAQNNAQITHNANSNIKTVASFATPFILSLISDVSKYADIIAYDVYEAIQLDTFVVQMQTLLTTANKQTLWISEFGCASLDDATQAAFLTKGLSIFQKNSVSVAIIWEWNEDLSLMIKGRQAESDIAEWLRSN